MTRPAFLGRRKILTSKNKAVDEKTKEAGLKLKIYKSQFVFRRQGAQSFFSKNICQMIAGLNNKYDITKTWGLVLV